MSNQEKQSCRDDPFGGERAFKCTCGCGLKPENMASEDTNE